MSITFHAQSLKILMLKISMFPLALVIAVQYSVLLSHAFMHVIKLPHVLSCLTLKGKKESF